MTIQVISYGQKIWSFEFGEFSDHGTSGVLFTTDIDNGVFEEAGITPHEFGQKVVAILAPDWAVNREVYCNVYDPDEDTPDLDEIDRDFCETLGGKH